MMDPYDAWEPWRLPDVSLSGGPEPLAVDEAALDGVPVGRPAAGFARPLRNETRTKQ